LTLLALFSLLLTAELPLPWAASLATGQTMGLVLAATMAACCYYARHSCFPYSNTGSGDLCRLCKLPKWPNSQHCPICEVCVANYSHHSEWLSSCIGAANVLPYVGCLLGMGVAAGCQAAGLTALLVFMICDKELAVRLSGKYSLRDEGYLFQLMLFFTILVTYVLTISSGLRACFCICKAISLQHRQKTGKRRISPLELGNKVQKSQGDFYDSVTVVCKEAAFS